MTSVHAAPSRHSRHSDPAGGRPEAGRPRLLSVPPDYVPKAIRERRRRRTLTALGIAAALMVLAVAASHAMLVQGQMRLQRLESEAATAQARYQRLRLNVAELEAPERIMAVAQERLGMIPPPEVTYLSPTGPVTGLKELAEVPTPSVPTPTWTLVKPHLSSVNPAG